jgi:uncharacterized protein YkwD
MPRAKTTASAHPLLRSALVIGVVVTLASLHGAQPASAARTERGVMTRLTNDDRAAHDVAPLKIDRMLSRYARSHSRAMERAGFLFHSADDQLRVALGDRRWVVAGENVGVGTDLDALEDAFMHSLPHRENVLRPDYVHTAVGVVRTSNRVWVTVIFWG